MLLSEAGSSTRSLLSLLTPCCPSTRRSTLDTRLVNGQNCRAPLASSPENDHQSLQNRCVLRPPPSGRSAAGERVGGRWQGRGGLLIGNSSAHSCPSIFPLRPSSNTDRRYEPVSPEPRRGQRSSNYCRKRRSTSALAISSPTALPLFPLLPCMLYVLCYTAR